MVPAPTLALGGCQRHPRGEEKDGLTAYPLPRAPPRRAEPAEPPDTRISHLSKAHRRTLPLHT